jgi:hypothetical protein
MKRRRFKKGQLESGEVYYFSPKPLHVRESTQKSVPKSAQKKSKKPGETSELTKAGGRRAKSKGKQAPARKAE